VSTDVLAIQRGAAAHRPQEQPVTGLRPDITAGQLAQARGCVPTNYCYWDCVRCAQEDLDEWDTLDEWSRQHTLELVPWIREQRWIP
jgi:hypothetical protein